MVGLKVEQTQEEMIRPMVSRWFKKEKYAYILGLMIMCRLSSAQGLPTFFLPSEVPSDLIQTHVNGNPRSFTIHTQSYNQSPSDKGPIPINVECFLQAGRVIKLNLLQKGNIAKTFLFDTLSRIVSITDFSEANPTPWINYLYSDTEKTYSEVLLKRDSSIYSKTVLITDENKRPTSRSQFWGETKLRSQRTYAYNAQGDVIKDIYKEGLGEVINTYTYAYDMKGRKSQRLKYLDSLLQSRTSYEYHADSSVTYTTEYGYDQKPKSQNLTILKDSARIEIQGYFANDDTLQYRSRFKEVYVGEDLLEYERRTIRGTFVDRYKTFYEFDEKGNWIKKTTYLNNKLIQTQTRIFRY